MVTTAPLDRLSGAVCISGGKVPTLPIPSLANEVPGNYLTSALWNANVYNGLTYLLGPPDFVGTQATAQSIPSSTFTPLALDTTQTDPYAGHSNTVNNSLWTCPAGVAGWYTVCGIYAVVGNTNGFRAVRIQVNGAPVLGTSIYGPPNGGSDVGLATPVRDVYLNAGDTISVAGWQNTGGALNTTIDPELRSALWVRFSHV